MNVQVDSAENYRSVVAELEQAAGEAGSPAPTLVAVSKTFSAEAIEPVIEAGCRTFGENRVQEAQGKWPPLLLRYPDISLHLIGPLQSNKAKDAVALFNVIQSIDREKIAKAVKREMDRQSKNIELFVQVNIGSEQQKSGVAPEEAEAFVAWCRHDLKLAISGLMCIPPVMENPGPYFALLRKLGSECAVDNLSMGMSADYRVALEFGATHVRVGSAIFGER